MEVGQSEDQTAATDLNAEERCCRGTSTVGQGDGIIAGAVGGVVIVKHGAELKAQVGASDQTARIEQERRSAIFTDRDRACSSDCTGAE